MRSVLIAALLAAVAATTASALVSSRGEGQYHSEFYGYISTDDGNDSNFFYGLRTEIPEAADRAKLPLVMFLQGGPGASSFFSDFMETGPYLVTRNNTLRYNPNTWARHATMLYVDNPIGSGFSYTKNDAGFSTTDTEIGANLVLFMKKFLRAQPQYVNNPFWVFCESYGGKMTAYFGAALLQSIEKGEFPPGFSFKGVALGDGWVDPVGCMYSYSDYLFSLGQSTKIMAANMTIFADNAKLEVAKGNGDTATSLWGSQQDYIANVTGNINWYNALYYYDYTVEDELNNFLANVFPNTPAVTRDVSIPVPFGAQDSKVFQFMSGSFMNDGIQQVEAMLATPNFTVAAYSGEVDVIVNTVCTRNWINKMTKWSNLAAFQDEPLKRFTNPHETGPKAQQVLATRQAFANMQLWTVMRAGHMVPMDSPLGSEIMFANIIGSRIPVGPTPPDASVDSNPGRVRKTRRYRL